MTKRILAIGSDATFQNDAKKKVRIFLSVNDIFFDFSNKKAEETSHAINKTPMKL